MLQREEIRHLAHAIARSALPVFGPQSSLFPWKVKVKIVLWAPSCWLHLTCVFFGLFFFPIYSFCA